MGIFSRKSRPVYAPLAKPALDSLRLPDLSVMRRDSQLIGTISAVAFKNLEHIDISQWPTMARLEQGLIDGLSGKYTDPEKVTVYVSIGVRLGYMTGILENKSEVAKDGLSEARYRNSLIYSWTQLQSIEPEYLGDVTYCMESGYYVARVGEPAISTVLATLAHQD